MSTRVVKAAYFLTSTGRMIRRGQEVEISGDEEKRADKLGYLEPKVGKEKPVEADPAPEAEVQVEETKPAPPKRRKPATK